MREGIISYRYVAGGNEGGYLKGYVVEKGKMVGVLQGMKQGRP